MAEAPDDTHVAVIGGGPVGLFAVFEFGMLGMQCAVLDTLDEIGGQCTALYPEKPIYDIPAQPKIAAAGLVEQLERQIAPFAPAFYLGHRVDALTRTADDRFLLTTSQGQQIRASAVVIAAGCGAFGPNRPPLANLARYEGKSVHYLVKRREYFRGKRIVIAGGGDSAVDWALSLHDVADQVMVVHRRDKFRAAPENVNQLRRLAEDGKIELVIPYQLAELEGQADGTLDAVHVKTLKGHRRRLPADVLLPFFGLAMELGPIAQWGLNLERNLIQADPATLETNAPGIYAIGDIASYPGKLKLIMCGFSESALAAHHAFGRVFPNDVLHFEYSTTKGVPGEA